MSDTATTTSTTSAAPVLQVQSLNAWYGAAQILFDVSLHVGRGEVVALMGRNGAGKSTTLKAIMGMVARQGGVQFLGQSIARSEPHHIARLGLGYVPEDRRIFTDLTVLENLLVGRQPPRRWPDGARAPEWTPEKLFALFPNLGEMPQRPGGRMSGGEQQMLTVARTLMGQPLLVLLDEPSEGVAPLIVQQMARTIRALKAQGVSVLLSEQNLPFAQAVADRAYLIEQGQIAHHGSMAEVVASDEVRRNYLGV
ncbi:MAG: ABC transporter ATP-binding protein [Acidovorax sp.]|uniref:ABC transporter ATP-binding protein n=1 Tax=Acidovorax sp. TaxID=1872122 RepID=UPI0026345C5A|nr:ABC transporter ATP-binding protein [Acidovorax sp.]MDH4426370.1 ABC transporter ATP-binding protein [Acidovorax sp.]MDH4446630.1 ABC transporter ATP-binding protein [Acidovorax sp.]MDH4464565.1 ABC transporter ATP-binding protein [Acidovorax sp.]